MTILVIEHEDEAPIGILGERWQEVGHVLDIRRPYLGDDQPAYLGPEHDALVVLGGYMGANDDAEQGHGAVRQRQYRTNLPQGR